MLTLGYKASAEQFGPVELLEFGVLADRHGFDSVMVSDHLQPWRHTNGHAPFALSWLGALGARTTRVRMGTSVLTPTFRYHPGIVAHAMATLACLYPKRIILGIGTGESMNEAPLGIAWPQPPERFARLKESIELMRKLWSEDFVTFDGQFYKTRDATIYDRPADGVPIYIAASGESAARLAGRVADGLICTSGKGEELYRDLLLPAMAEGAKKAGRDADRIDRLIEIKISYDHDTARAAEDTRHWAALALPSEAKLGVEDPREMERLAAALPLEKVVTRWIVTGDADEAVSRIGWYVKLGFNHLVFHAPGPDQARFIQTFSAEVMPKLRAAHG